MYVVKADAGTFGKSAEAPRTPAAPPTRRPSSPAEAKPAAGCTCSWESGGDEPTTRPGAASSTTAYAFGSQAKSRSKMPRSPSIFTESSGVRP